jgi:hypothetical protein
VETPCCERASSRRDGDDQESGTPPGESRGARHSAILPQTAAVVSER